MPTEVTAHGICMYQSPSTGKLYAYPNSTSGRLEQWEIAVSGSSVTATSVRLFDCEDTDGIDATASALGTAFPQGLFVCQDGSNGTPGTSGNQNFKFVPLQKITAGLG